MLNPRGFAAPLHRVLAVDAGSRCIRLLLLEERFRLRVVLQETIDLQAEGLIAPEELKTHVQRRLADWGRPPLVLVLPQDVAVSQLVDLPPVAEAEAHKLIEAEIAKLGGTSESGLVYDFAAVPQLAGPRQSFWVTFCQESEIQSRIAQLGLEDQDFQEITTAANALLTAWHHARPGSEEAILVHMGAQNTTLAAVRHGVGVFAASFPMGGNFFTRSIARLACCSEEVAERLQRDTDLLTGEKMLPGFPEIATGWAAELKRQLSEWRGQPFALTGNLMAAGAAFELPGLRDFLARTAGLEFKPWPDNSGPEGVSATPGFEIALGAALQALGHGPQKASLLPASRRQAWKRRRNRQRVELFNFGLLVVCFVVLVLGLWQKVSLVQRQQALADKVQAGWDAVQENNALNRELLQGYEELRPLCERQQRTLDTLQSLALLESVRSNRNWWGVLLADQQSYFTLPQLVVTTNQAATPANGSELATLRREATNAPARPGVIAELCVPEDVDAARKTLSLVVNDLKQSPVFERVDVLPEDLRRNLAEPKVLLPGRHFALVLDFAATQFQAGATSKIRPPAGRLPVADPFLR